MFTAFLTVFNVHNCELGQTDRLRSCRAPLGARVRAPVSFAFLTDAPRAARRPAWRFVPRNPPAAHARALRCPILVDRAARCERRCDDGGEHEEKSEDRDLSPAPPSDRQALIADRPRAHPRAAIRPGGQPVELQTLGGLRGGDGISPTTSSSKHDTIAVDFSAATGGNVRTTAKLCRQPDMQGAVRAHF